MDTCKAIRDIRQEGYDEGHEEGMLEVLRDRIRAGVITDEDAAKYAGLTPEEFERKVAAIQKR